MSGREAANVPGPALSLWNLSHRFDATAGALADRHYNRQKPGTPQFMPPGRCLVLLTPCVRALWGTSWPKFVRHRWPGAWVCSVFRTEGAEPASCLIRSAVAATVARYGSAPDLGMVTFIDRRKVRPIKVRGFPTWGRTWKLAGFREDGETQGGLMALRLHPEDMPEPVPAAPMATHGLPLFADAAEHTTGGAA